MIRLRYFAFGLLCFALCGWIPGPQGAASGGTFTGGTLTSALLLANGSVGAPALAFASTGNDDTGLYLPTNNALAFSTAGTEVLRMTSSALTVKNTLLLQDDRRLVHGTSTDVFEQGELTTITDNVQTTIFSVVMGDGDMAGITLTYTIQCTDGTEYQAEHGTVRIALVDDAGGVVRSIAEDAGTQQALSSGTIDSAWEVTTTDDQSIEVHLTSNSSLTPSTMQVRWHIVATGDVTITVP